MKKAIKAVLLSALLVFSPLSLAEMVDINSATAQQLAQQLNGIGMVKAQAIVEYRQQHGPFASVEQLVAVKGVGEKLLERNRASLEARMEPVGSDNPQQ